MYKVTAVTFNLSQKERADSAGTEGQIKLRPTTPATSARRDYNVFAFVQIEET